MDDKELESVVYNYFDNEVPEPNQKILDELKIKMHQRTTTATKKSFKKFRFALASCIVVILLIPAVILPFMWNNLFPSDPEAPPTMEEEIYYSDSNLTMVDLTPEELNSILSGEFSKYATLLEDYTINLARGYFGENDVLVYLKLEINKNIIPFTIAELNIVFVENYEHEYSNFFKEVSEFTQYENCKLFETDLNSSYKKVYYKFLEFDDYKVYIQLDKKDSSIINTIIQN